MNSCEPRAMFRTVRAALSFAYYSNEFAGGADGLTPQERHAQCALIRRTVEQRLHGIYLAAMFATYGAGEVRRAAIREVCWHAAKQLRNRTLGVELAKRQFASSGKRRALSDLGKQFSMSTSALTTLADCVTLEIARLQAHADAELQAALVDSRIAETL